MISPADHTRALLTAPTLTRRAFVKVGGALVVSVSLPAAFTAGLGTAEAADGALDATKLASWLELRADNTILARTGRVETGTGMSAFYAQVIAEELNVQPETISLVTGNTDETPDGGFSAGFLSGADNLRKVSAYTYQALLGLASTRLGVPVASLTVTNGVVAGGGKSVSYGQLVQGQKLDLAIPIQGSLPRLDPKENTGVAGLVGFTVAGNPPTKPVSQYTVIGKSHPMPGIPDKITGKTVWTADVRLPGMLHARMVRPATLGSTLISAGRLDRKLFPTAEVVTKGNLVAVLSPNEWEAVGAARAVAAQTKWTTWAGLPGSENVTKAIRAYPWGAPTGSRGNAAGVTAGLAKASKTISATYEQPYVKHAPIGPYAAVADVRDGKVTIWTHSSQSQGLRVQIANALSVPVANVTIRWVDQSGQYGRTTFGGDGAEGDAAVLSQLVGKPVHVQWTLQEDLAWSTLSPGWVADLKAGLDAQGNLIAVRSDWYSPHENDARLLGAVLAGMPSVTPKPNIGVSTVWPYDKVANVLEQAYGMPNIGSDATTAGLRGNIMRTPWQRQQNFAIESLINEAAAVAAADPVEFRIRHTTDQRLIDVINATAHGAGWQTRPSPNPKARRSGSAPLIGRGMGVMIRTGGYWAGIAEVEVTPSTGKVRVTNFTIGVEVGKVINPRQLKLSVQGGLVMGLGEALKEEVTFDTGKVTSTDWKRYQILTMEEMPEVRIVQVSRDDQAFGAGGEGPNALAPHAVAAAFFDATGVQPRRIPLTPAYVMSLLKA